MPERPEKRRKLDPPLPAISLAKSPASPRHAAFSPSSPSVNSSYSTLRSHDQSNPLRVSTTVSDTSSAPSVHVSWGDDLVLDGYRDVRIMSVHYDDTVACRAISLARGDKSVFLKLSLTAKPSAVSYFILKISPDETVANITPSKRWITGCSIQSRNDATQLSSRVWGTKHNQSSWARNGPTRSEYMI